MDLFHWRADTLAAVDALLAEDVYPSLNSSDRAKLRQDIYRLTCDQTLVFIARYRDQIEPCPPVR